MPVLCLLYWDGLTLLQLGLSVATQSPTGHSHTDGSTGFCLGTKGLFRAQLLLVSLSEGWGEQELLGLLSRSNAPHITLPIPPSLQKPLPQLVNELSGCLSTSAPKSTPLLATQMRRNYVSGNTWTQYNGRTLMFLKGAGC